MISNLLPGRRLGTTLAIGCVAVTLLAACSSSGGSTSPQEGAPAQGSAPSGFARAGGGGNFGAAATGEIAAKSGKTLQVQSSTVQTAVTYSAKTAFSQQKLTTLKAVKVGSCIVATSSSSSSSTAALTATSVQIETRSCTNRFAGNRTGGGTGALPSGVPSGLPTGVPGGSRPSGAPSGFAGRGGLDNMVTGKVTAVSGSTFTVQARSFTASGSSGTTERTVAVTGKTVYRTTVKTTSAAAKVGRCAVVQGSTNAKGAVAALQISLSNKTNGTCSTGFAAGSFPGRPNG
jgi:hypothetical protein